MQFPTPLQRGALVRRYKRFLADVDLDSGERVVAHCPNPGSMAGLAEPGAEVWLSPAAGPKRKLRWTWELVRDAETGSPVGINTGRANAIVEEALRAGRADPALAGAAIRREVRYGSGSRVDFLLTPAAGPPCHLEVKSVTLRRSQAPPHIGEFPDAATARGARHLRELAAVCRAGGRAMLLYLVQREDCAAVRIAADIDPAYAAAAAAARDAGVEFRALGCRVSAGGIAAAGPLPVGI
ncbi:MAG: DNA/RNA nuclease SfsA [Rhodospirillaceae bacterium]|nr:DNA/RNA nuclease SfsA [Rhodospirillaceae bacterium]